MTKEIKNQGTKKQGKSDKGNITLKDVKFEIEPGMVVRVHEKIREKNAKGEEKERVQIFEGIVIAHKHGKEMGSTVTVRKDSNGIGVEKVFPLNSPLIDKIELKSRIKSSKSKLYYLRDYKKRLKKVSI